MKRIILSVLLLTYTTKVVAKTNVDEKIEQMKSNVAASRANASQYESNLKVAKSNITETEKALKELDSVKKALKKQKADTATGKERLDKAKAELQSYVTEEELKIKKEEEQLNQLKQAVLAAEANISKRKQNIAQYQQKMQGLDSEFAAWADRDQSVKELEQAVKEKEDKALADKKSWDGKRLAYEQELDKWKKQTRQSEKHYEGFKDLKN